MSQPFALSLFPEWDAKLSRQTRFANRVLRKLKTGLCLERLVDASSDMTTLSQRLSMAQLLTDVIHSDVAGDIVECGCFEGKTAALLTRVAHEIDDTRVVHVYERLSPGGVCVLIDCNDGTFVPVEETLYPAVKSAADEFFEDKPEKLIPIWSGQDSMAFIRRSLSSQDEQTDGA